MAVLSNIRLGSSLGFYPQMTEDFITTADAVTGCGCEWNNTWNSSSTNLVLNQGIFVPVIVPTTFPLNAIFMLGQDADGNMDMGVYDTSGTRIVSTGSTANANSVVSPSISSSSLSPGQYYLAWSSDNNTTQDVNGLGAVSLYVCFAMGVKVASSAFPLPASVSLTDPSVNTELPFIGISKRTVI